MGKLNIAHHKSYHPYRRDNIERVRRDEEEAARQEAEQEGRIALADAEARLSLLRERAGIGGKGKEKADAVASAESAGLGPGKHINFFEDLEQQAMMTAIRATKKTAPSEAEKGVALAPSAKDLRPWYADKASGRGQMADDEQDERRQRDRRSKSMNDPLTSITQQLASKRPLADPRPRPLRQQLDPTTARLHRESSERERAQALVRRKQREVAGGDTPSTMHGGGYGDVYNRRAVEEAHARWRRRGG